MGCVVVRPRTREADDTGSFEGKYKGEDNADDAQSLEDHVICLANNTPIFTPFRSECHAEFSAVAAISATELSIRNSTVYVTRAPCSHCFRALAKARVARIVCPQPYSSAAVAEAAKRLGIRWTVHREPKEYNEVRNAAARKHEDMALVKAMRECRKLMRKNKKDKGAARKKMKREREDKDEEEEEGEEGNDVEEEEEGRGASSSPSPAKKRPRLDATETKL